MVSTSPSTISFPPCPAEHLRLQIEALLSTHSVDLVFSGHVHSYARTCNVLDGRCVDMKRGGCAAAPIHVGILVSITSEG